MSAERDLLLLIADISGYTRFLVSNQTEMEHSHTIVRSLLEALLQEVEIPLTVAKLEGDAVFLYLDKSAGENAIQRVAGTLQTFFAVFSARLRELAQSRTCTCGACRNIDRLRLKIIAHSGKTLLYSIAGRTELAGIDVVVLHRLLKNSIPHHEYIALTDPARRDLPLDLPLLLTTIERYDEIGQVTLNVYSPSRSLI